MSRFRQKLKVAKTPKKCLELYHITHRRKALKKFESLVSDKLRLATSLDACQKILLLVPHEQKLLKKKVLKKMCRMARSFSDCGRVLILISQGSMLWCSMYSKMLRTATTSEERETLSKF